MKRGVNKKHHGDMALMVTMVSLFIMWLSCSYTPKVFDNINSPNPKILHHIATGSIDHGPASAATAAGVSPAVTPTAATAAAPLVHQLPTT